MTRNELLVRIAATLTTLNETGGSPESMIYLAFGANLDEWVTLKTILLESKMISVRGNYVTLTELGKKTAEEIDSKIQKN